MDQPPAVAFTAFADAWPRVTETEIGAALCAFGAGRTVFLTRVRNDKAIINLLNVLYFLKTCYCLYLSNHGHCFLVLKISLCLSLLNS